MPPETFAIVNSSHTFLPPMVSQKDFTLVLDLDETLVHYDDQTNLVNIRPGAEKFLDQMAKYYEIVIFTAGTQDYAEWALTHL